MFLKTNWEIFYTQAKGTKGEDDLMDQVCIDGANKRYILDEGAFTEDKNGCGKAWGWNCSSYVSREIFDMLVDALKLNGYKKANFE